MRVLGVGHGPQGALGVELVDVHVLHPVAGPDASHVDEAPPVADPGSVLSPPQILERGLTPGLGATFAPGSDDFSERHRDDHEHQRAFQRRAGDAAGRHPGGADHGELRRDGQGPEPDEGPDHRGERKLDEGVSRKGQEHELDRIADAVAPPADGVELVDEGHHRGKRQEHRKREQRAAYDMTSDVGVEDPHEAPPSPRLRRAERSFAPRRRPPVV